MQQGIIAQQNIKVRDNAMFINGALEHHELRRYLLYWDQIIYPIINGHGPTSDIPELNYLNNSGILLMEDVEVSIESIISPGFSLIGMELSAGDTLSNFHPLVEVEAQLKLAKDKLKQGEIWSIAQSGENIQLPTSGVVGPAALEFSLFNCLPVPGASVPFDDIINFRIKNKNKLSDLHEQIEGYRKKVVESQDPMRELVLAKHALNSLVSDLASCMSRINWTYHFDSLTSYFELSEDSLIKSALGMALAHGLSIPIEIGGVGGYTANIGMNVIRRKLHGFGGIPEPLRNYLYLYNASKNQIVKL